jgi:hypothetical protein
VTKKVSRNELAWKIAKEAEAAVKQDEEYQRTLAAVPSDALLNKSTNL